MMAQDNEEPQRSGASDTDTAKETSQYIPLPMLIGALGAIIMVPILLMIVTASPNRGAPVATSRPVSNSVVQPPRVTVNPSTGVGLGVSDSSAAVGKNTEMSKGEKQDVKAERKATATAVAAARAQRASIAATPAGTTKLKQKQDKVKTGKNGNRASQDNPVNAPANPVSITP